MITQVMNEDNCDSLVWVVCYNGLVTSLLFLLLAFSRLNMTKGVASRLWQRKFQNIE